MAYLKRKITDSIIKQLSQWEIAYPNATFEVINNSNFKKWLQ